MRMGSLFSGIGGFELAGEWMGWETVFTCEKEEFNRRVLKYYWPEAKHYEDIIKTDFSVYRGRVDILTGGFPCQPYSSAGSRKGKEDARHLWPQMLRAIREIKPQWIVGENVSGITSWNGGLVFEEIQNELESEGSQVQPILLPALSVGADHVRERVWFVAYSGSLGRCDVHNNDRGSFKEESDTKRNWEKVKWWEKEADVLDSSCNTFLRYEEMYGEPPVFTLDDGLPSGLDGITFSKWLTGSLRAAGNAIVPQVAYQIFNAIDQYKQFIESNP